MSENRAVIYISEITDPTITIESQEKWCRKKLEQMNYQNITVFKDEKGSHERYEKMLSEIGYYDILCVYSVRNFGREYMEIIRCIKRVLETKSAKFCSCTEPNLSCKTLGEFFTNKSLTTSLILGAMSLYKFWEDMVEK